MARSDWLAEDEENVPSPPIADLAKAAAEADLQGTPTPAPPAVAPSPPPKDYGKGFDELLANSGEDAKRAELRNQKLSATEVLPYILAGLASRHNGGEKAIQGMIAAREAKRTGDVEAFDKARSQKVSDYMARKKFSEIEESDDPNSAPSKLAQDYMKRVAPDKDWSGYSATQIKPIAQDFLKNKEADSSAKLSEAKIEETRAWRDQMLHQRKEDSKRKTDESEKKDIGDSQEAFNKSPVRQQAETGIDRVDTALGQLELALRGNQVARNSVEAMIAQAAMPQNKRFNEKLSEKFGQAAVADRLHDAWTKAVSGGISSKDAKEMKQLLVMYRDAAKATLAEEGMRHAKQLAQRNGKTPEENYEKIVGQPFEAGAPEGVADESAGPDPYVSQVAKANGVSYAEADHLLKKRKDGTAIAGGAPTPPPRGSAKFQ